MHIEFKDYRESLPSAVRLPKLDYTYEEVSSVMITEMLDLHYSKLHQGYIDRYNKAQSSMNLTQLIYTPEKEEEKALLFNLGGFLNHSLFWKSFNPNKETHILSDKLEHLIKKSFQKDLCEEIVDMLPKIRGSGWIWLTYCKATDLLQLEITMNQDFPNTPILLNIDLWEHAYLIQYKVDKVQYITSLYSILNWKFASERLDRILNE
ncbi:superoxide dismutase, Fe-Mn family [Nematocida minor]|uniref:superoxide dismutase, Fe-Mn family n=1 Tax=Nematocida minor TaxID=1912983 RepID=UPI00221F9F92|nr:superoxide dismutase, Fe-Mn family [Nematocida minor]KAI5189664.1 superoxide dismutase, Fe-Mn family [Nematocida minor]